MDCKNPETLGEELLIIQKEFDGFSETNERLDLLALDKSGNLVIIENKLDDTGKDVVWQALKYASYCSTLSTAQVIEIYQRFLEKMATGEDARSSIVEFLKIENEESLVLNSDDQRIMFVANHYRKEVTSTVMWLLDHDLKIQCFRATPFSLRDDLFLQVEQIIPVPEVSEFIIEIKEKQKADRTRSKKVEETRADLTQFWGMVKRKFSHEDDDFFANISATHYFDFGFAKNNGRFSMVIGRSGTRVELYIGNDLEKKRFDHLYQYAEQLQAQYDGKLIWQRLDDKKASRVKYEVSWAEQEKNFGAWMDPEARPLYVEWFVEELKRFYAVMYPIWKTIQE